MKDEYSADNIIMTHLIIKELDNLKQIIKKSEENKEVMIK